MRVPPFQGGRNMGAENPGLRSRTRSSLGYNIAGLQPWEVGAIRVMALIGFTQREERCGFEGASGDEPSPPREGAGV